MGHERDIDDGRDIGMGGTLGWVGHWDGWDMGGTFRWVGHWDGWDMGGTLMVRE